MRVEKIRLSFIYRVNAVMWLGPVTFGTIGSIPIPDANADIGLHISHIENQVKGLYWVMHHCECAWIKVTQVWLNCHHAMII